MKVKVAEGRAVRDPVTKTLHVAGDERDVPDTIFWRRRLRDGDVEPVEDTHRRHAGRGE